MALLVVDAKQGQRIVGVAVAVEALATTLQVFVELNAVVGFEGVDVVLDGALRHVGLIGLA